MRFEIGQFSFLSLHGGPLPPTHDVEPETRPGVDGVAIWDMGVRGKPFVLRSVVDARDKAHARELFVQYCSLKAADAVTLVWSDLLMAIEGWQVAVLDVRPVEITAVIAVLGGINPPSLGWVVAEWMLVAVGMNQITLEAS